MESSCPIKSIYEKYGGKETVATLVDHFYGLVLADELVAPFFAETNMKVQKQHQTNFLCLALGGPNEYTGKNMRDAHAHMKLGDDEFNAIAGHLSATLKHFNVEENDINAILSTVSGLKDDVLNR